MLYESGVGGIYGYLLFMLRLISLAYIAGLVLVEYQLTSSSGKIYKFGYWNNIGLALYFLLATVSSVVGLILQFNEERVRGIDWPIIVQKLGYLQFLCLETFGANSIFVTIVHFTYFNATFDSTSITIHLMNTVAIMLELVLSKIPVQLAHYTWTLGFVMVYLCFAWAMVFTSTIAWPYKFLETHSSTCFLIYTILLVIHFSCFYGFYLLASLRDYLLAVHDSNRFYVDDSDNFETASSRFEHMWGEKEGNKGRYDDAEHKDGNSTVQLTDSLTATGGIIQNDDSDEVGIGLAPVPIPGAPLVRDLTMTRRPLKKETDLIANADFFSL